MKVIKKILDFIFYPFAAIFSIQMTDAISRQCRKYPIIIFFVGLVITAITVFVVYY